ncbi:MAG: YbjN domain-containing protein [Polyangiales bacterium]
MRSVDDVERYLQSSEINYSDLGGGMYLVDVHTTLSHSLVIKVEPPLVVFRLKAGPLPAAGSEKRAALFESLLRLNGTALLHSSFSIADDGVYLTAALPLDNLDQNELQAVVDDMSMAVSQHLPELSVDNAN